MSRLQQQEIIKKLHDNPRMEVMNHEQINFSSNTHHAYYLLLTCARLQLSLI